MIKCKICQKEFDSLNSLGQHLAHPKIKKSHNIKGTKDYYDLFLKKDQNEGICKIEGCNNNTTYINLIVGYLKYCSHKCYNLDPEIKNIRSESNRNRKVTKETRLKMSRTRIKLWRVPNSQYKMLDPELQKIKGQKVKNLWKLRDIDMFSSYGMIWSIKTSINMKRAWADPNSFWRSKEFIDKVTPGRRKHMLDGGAAYCNSFIQNPSKPQVELYNRIKEIYPAAILNYPCYELNYSLDIAIPELKLWFESDGSYWHKDKKEQDSKRQKEIEDFLGWDCIRYIIDSIGQVPCLKTIKEDIKSIKTEIKING